LLAGELALMVEVLQGTAATVVGQDAGRPSAMVVVAETLLTLADQVASRSVHNAHAGPLTGE